MDEVEARQLFGVGRIAQPQRFAHAPHEIAQRLGAIATPGRQAADDEQAVEQGARPGLGNGGIDGGGDGNQHHQQQGDRHQLVIEAEA